MSRLADNIFGPAPARTATRADQLRWVRRFYTRSGLPLVVTMLLVAAVVGAPGELLALLGGCLVVELIGLASITQRIRRADRYSRHMQHPG